MLKHVGAKQQKQYIDYRIVHLFGNNKVEIYHNARNERYKRNALFVFHFWVPHLHSRCLGKPSHNQTTVQKYKLRQL